ncbi:DUF4405 domain-containing protein [Desulforhopalus vacuolatus]|uniref:DUF4405 domain-containing protein n=1 Tax=Desulforhopalus vacuolatus TaxID=40414 RepID=UPI00196666CC|nr:DUF4405 domain-containing protein [Desulforhopalus vacuolatus]MBM9520747.1 DUF4405 domain-containing protein [Desulforhopalus vacuolatus]
MNLRRITSLTMLLSFIVLVLTSIVLYIVPEGRVAYWSEWKFIGLSKTQWGDIHINIGFLFLVAGLLHLFYNWKPMLAYMKDKTRKVKVFTTAFNVALLLTAICTIGTLMNIPPFSSILEFGNSFKDAAAEKYGEPPYGHAERSSLQMFAKRTGLDLKQMKTQLTSAHIAFTNESETLLDIAGANNMTPQAIYDVIRSGEPQFVSGEKTSFPDAPFPGLGRKILSDLCNEYSLDTTYISHFVKILFLIPTDALGMVRSGLSFFSAILKC